MRGYNAYTAGTLETSLNGGGMDGRVQLGDLGPCLKLKNVTDLPVKILFHSPLVESASNIISSYFSCRFKYLELSIYLIYRNEQRG